MDIDKKIEELLGQLGKTKENLARELEELYQYVESQEHRYLDLLTLQRMFSENRASRIGWKMQDGTLNFLDMSFLTMN